MLVSEMAVITAVIRSAVRWWTGYWISMKIRQDKSWERNELGRVKNVGQNSTKRQDFMWLSKQSRPSCLERRGDWPKCFWRSQFQFWRLQLQPQSVTSKCILRARGSRSKIWGRLLRRTISKRSVTPWRDESEGGVLWKIGENCNTGWESQETGWGKGG